VLRFVVSCLHVAVIETHKGAASLYGKTTSGDNICMLLKCVDGESDFTLDGKCEREGPLVAVFGELEAKWNGASMLASPIPAAAPPVDATAVAEAIEKVVAKDDAPTAATTGAVVAGEEDEEDDEPAATNPMVEGDDDFEDASPGPGDNDD
jgi:hypothetical protein